MHNTLHKIQKNIIMLWNYYDEGIVNGFDNNLQN